MDRNNAKNYKADVKVDEQEKEVEYDQVLSAAGEFGPYQVALFFKTGPFYMILAFVYLTQVFMTEVPINHWCRIPELKNLTALERRTLAIPADKDSPVGYSRCLAYVANWTEVVLTKNVSDQSWATQKCQDGWEFNLTEIPYPTISSELGWVCDKNSYQARAQSLFFVGSIIGGFIVGWVADRFGRISAAVTANAIGCIAGIITIFSRNFLEFAICRIFMGMAFDNCMNMTFLLVLEYTVPKYRTLMANVSFAIFFTIGVVTLPWIALACGHWKVISLVTSIPLAFAFLLPFILPESPRWLITRGRIDDVIKNVKTIARVNKKVMPENLLEKFQITCEMHEQKKYTSLLELLKRPVLRNMFLCICVLYLCCSIIIDTLIRTIGSLHFDFFLSFTVISFTEFPSLILLSFIFDLTGRKWLLIITLVTVAIFAFITPFVGEGLPSVLCAVFARFCCNMACNGIMQWAAELIPTPVRGSGTSVVHICGYIANCISPFIAYLNNYVIWLPLLTIGAIALLAASLSSQLPETAGKEMPQTFEEVESMMLNRTLWEMPCLQKESSHNKRNYSNNTFEMD